MGGEVGEGELGCWSDIFNILAPKAKVNREIPTKYKHVRELWLVRGRWGGNIESSGSEN